MSSRRFEFIVIILLVVLVCAGVYVGLRNLSYFNVVSVEVSVNGPVSEVRSDIERLVNPLKGMNILEIDAGSVKRSIQALDGVESAEVRKYYPDRIIVSVNYLDLDARAYCVDDEGVVSYFFVDGSNLLSASAKTWEEFDRLPIVELNPVYAQMVLKWGSDQGFASMVPLVEHLGRNSLITSIKYDNNNGSDFGRLVLSLPSLNVQLYVRELVSVQRLDEALAVIEDQSSTNGSSVVFDLYSNTLVKRA